MENFLQNNYENQDCVDKNGQTIAWEGKRKYSDLAGPAGVIQSCEREGGEGGDVVHSTWQTNADKTQMQNQKHLRRSTIIMNANIILSHMHFLFVYTQCGQTQRIYNQTLCAA